MRIYLPVSGFPKYISFHVSADIYQLKNGSVCSNIIGAEIDQMTNNEKKNENFPVQHCV